MASPYAHLIVRHYQQPVGFGHPDRVLSQAVLQNPVCGDEVYCYISPEKQVYFEAKGCMLCVASASILAEQARLVPFEHWIRLSRQASEMLQSGGTDYPESILALSDVKRFPMRQRCVLLAWKAFGSALDGLIPS
jgi:nitrogen fixation NifU-like protein